MAGAAQTQFHLGAQENLVHQIPPPTLPGTSPDTLLPDPASILRKGKVLHFDGITVVTEKREAQTSSNGPLGPTTDSAQSEFKESIMDLLSKPAKNLIAGLKEQEAAPCDCGKYSLVWVFSRLIFWGLGGCPWLFLVDLRCTK